ncbi:MAG: tricarballylate utilization protein TcuB, partial [Gammaproteobacteria bacterium]
MHRKVSECGASTPIRDEARRVMTICNACRYCEGLCATFQAMARRRTFSDWDLDYLANLCHNCTACYYGCQYAPPHAFDVNVPLALSELRVESYARYAWPAFIAGLFERNALVMTLVTALSLAFVIVLTLALRTPETLFATQTGPGAFYAVIPHGIMAGVAGVTFGFSALALMLGYRNFMRASVQVPRRSLAALIAALGDI